MEASPSQVHRHTVFGVANGHDARWYRSSDLNRGRVEHWPPSACSTGPFAAAASHRYPAARARAQRPPSSRSTQRVPFGDRYPPPDTSSPGLPVTATGRYTVSARVDDLISAERLAYRSGRVLGTAGLRLKAGGSVLDVGCGTGLNHPLLVDAVGVTGRWWGWTTAWSTDPASTGSTPYRYLCTVSRAPVGTSVGGGARCGPTGRSRSSGRPGGAHRSCQGARTVGPGGLCSGRVRPRWSATAPT